MQLQHSSSFLSPIPQFSQQKLTPHNISFTLKFKTSLHSSLPSEVTLLQKPKCPNPPISTIYEPDPFPIHMVNNNTVLDVLRLFDTLRITVTPDIYASLVDECTRNRDAVMALKLYDHMKGNHRMIKWLKGSSGLLLVNRILMMFVSCRCLDIAHQMFDEMSQRNSISVAILVAGFVNCELFERGLGLFVRMYECFVGGESCLALRVVVVCVLRGCVKLKNVCLGKMVHGWLIKMGYGRELFVGTALVEFYGRCRCVSEANRLFCEHVKLDDCHDTALWTEVIVNNCRQGCFEEVIQLFKEMVVAGVRMNENSISSVLKACGRLCDDGSFGRQVHGIAVKLALENHALTGCGLVEMYARCGFLKEARKVFNMIDDAKRNKLCWNAMISGLVQHGMFIEAIKMLYQMKAAGLQPKQSVIDEVRMACGSLNLRMSTDGGNLNFDDINPVQKMLF